VGAEPAPTQPPTGPTILLDQERLLSQVPRGTHEGKAAPVLGGIPLLSKIGQGGMGAVYYGISPTSQLPVAVKVLPLQLEDQAHVVDRFLREARIATVVKSPHLVAVLDVGHDNGLYYFQMEYVRGKSAGGYLRGLVGENPGTDEGTALEICIAATKGLAAAHAANIIHRDIKPDNILLPEGSAGELLFEQAKLADLGLARSLSDDQTMTATQTALGTPGYMSPEQCRDAKRADMAADIFSMGATLYALLTGRPPFSGRTTVDTILATLTRQHMPVKQFRGDVSEMTCEVIERCLSKEPRIRYENASKLLEALLTCRDLRKGMSTLGLGLRTPGVPGTENTATVHEAHSVQAAKAPHTPTPRPIHDAQARRGPNVLALACGLVLIGGVAVWTALPYFNKPDPKSQLATAQKMVAPAPITVAPPTTTAIVERAPAAAAPESHPTPAEQLLRKLHEERPAASVAPAVKVEEKPVARVVAPAVKQPSDEEIRRAKAAQQRRLDADQAQAKADKFAKDVDFAQAGVQKAKNEADLAQREVDRLQNEERALKDQFAQMETKMRAMQQQRQGPGPNGPRGSERDRGGRGGQPPPPPQMDPRVQQMMGQMMDQQNKLREKMPQAQQQLRDRQQAFNRATYELQKAEGMAKMAADEAARLKEKLLD